MKRGEGNAQDQSIEPTRPHCCLYLPMSEQTSSHRRAVSSSGVYKRQVHDEAHEYVKLYDETTGRRIMMTSQNFAMNRDWMKSQFDEDPRIQVIDLEQGSNIQSEPADSKGKILKVSHSFAAEALDLFINLHYSSKEVLICCKSGRSRTPTLVVIFYQMFRHVTGKMAKLFVEGACREQRPTMAEMSRVDFPNYIKFQGVIDWIETHINALRNGEKTDFDVFLEKEIEKRKTLLQDYEGASSFLLQCIKQRGDPRTFLSPTPKRRPSAFVPSSGYFTMDKFAKFEKSINEQNSAVLPTRKTRGQHHTRYVPAAPSSAASLNVPNISSQEVPSMPSLNLSTSEILLASAISLEEVPFPEVPFPEVPFPQPANKNKQAIKQRRKQKQTKPSNKSSSSDDESSSSDDESSSSDDESSSSDDESSSSDDTSSSSSSSSDDDDDDDDVGCDVKILNHRGKSSKSSKFLYEEYFLQHKYDEPFWHQSDCLNVDKTSLEFQLVKKYDGKHPLPKAARGMKKKIKGGVAVPVKKGGEAFRKKKASGAAPVKKKDGPLRKRKANAAPEQRRTHQRKKRYPDYVITPENIAECLATEEEERYAMIGSICSHILSGVLIPQVIAIEKRDRRCRRGRTGRGGIGSGNHL